MEYNTVALKKYNQLFNHPLNGTYFTETAGSVYKDLLFVTGFISEATHKYFLAMPNNDNLYTAVNIGGYREMSTTSAVSPTKLITEAQAGYTSNYIYVRLKPGKSITNSQVWFSIVDLTRLYGTGNEPTDVGQFLADYPQFNGCVEYKENGYFEKKYSSLTLRKSKNLFDISKVNSYAQYLINNADGSITVNTIGAQGASSPNKLKDFCPNLRAGDTITLSANSTVSTANDRIIYLTKSSRVCGFGMSYTITQDDLDSTVYFYSDRTLRVPATISNIMIELGSTATEYEPYGWIEKEYNALTLKKYNQLVDFASENKYWYVSLSVFKKESIENGFKLTQLIDITNANGAGFTNLDSTRLKSSIIGHIYFYSIRVKSNIQIRIRFRNYAQTWGGISYTLAANQEKVLTHIETANISSYQAYIGSEYAHSLSDGQWIFECSDVMIIDLTEMYGAGNEPTTVQKFLEDNPQYNDYVPYSEGGWM